MSNAMEFVGSLHSLFKKYGKKINKTTKIEDKIKQLQTPLALIG